MPPTDQQPAPVPIAPQQPVAAMPPATPPAGPPPKNKKLLFIIGGAVLLVLLLAAGAWWFMNRDNKKGNEAGQTAQTSNITKVLWVEPFDMPAVYEKEDKSFDVVKTFGYYDDTNDCFITTDVTPFGTYSRYGKTPREVALDLEGTEEDGVNIVKNEPGPKYTFKDIDGKETYEFESMQLQKELSIESVDYTNERTIVAYKPFGVYAVSMGFTCREESWEKQRPVLEALIKQFTLRTERP